MGDLPVGNGALHEGACDALVFWVIMSIRHSYWPGCFDLDCIHCDTLLCPHGNVRQSCFIDPPSAGVQTIPEMGDSHIHHPGNRPSLLHSSLHHQSSHLQPNLCLLEWHWQRWLMSEPRQSHPCRLRHERCNGSRNSCPPLAINVVSTHADGEEIKGCWTFECGWTCDRIQFVSFDYDCSGWTVTKSDHGLHTSRANWVSFSLFSIFIFWPSMWLLC